jgi:DEAD/DEAH box helicase domain-containing protein
MKQIILDVETKKTFDQVGGYHPEKLGISFVGVIRRDGFPESGSATETTHELFEKDLDRLWPMLETADVIVGFNLIDFDLPTFKPYYPGNITKLPALDLMVRIQQNFGRRISLDAVAKETLGSQKTGTGLDAITYYQQKQWDKLKKYCMQDVALTRDLYDHGRIHGQVTFKNRWNNVINLPVDFHFSPPQQAVQMTLV